ncbi:hypothetical protein D1872_347420 [compost metagenome]
MELARFDGGNHLIGEVELLGVGTGQYDALLAGDAVDLAHPEEAFDLLVDATHSLHVAELIDRASHRETLGDRLAG